MLKRIVCGAVPDAFYQPLRASTTLSCLVYVDICSLPTGLTSEMTLNLSVTGPAKFHHLH